MLICFIKLGETEKIAIGCHLRLQEIQVQFPVLLSLNLDVSSPHYCSLKITFITLPYLKAYIIGELKKVWGDVLILQ